MLRLWQIPAKPARGSGARILELDIGTPKNDFREGRGADPKVIPKWPQNEEAPVPRGGPGAPPVCGFSADLLKKRPNFCKNVEIASK